MDSSIKELFDSKPQVQKEIFQCIKKYCGKDDIRCSQYEKFKQFLSCSKAFNSDDEFNFALKLMKNQTRCERKMKLEGEKSYEKLIMKRNEEPTDFINKVQEEFLNNEAAQMQYKGCIESRLEGNKWLDDFVQEVRKNIENPQKYLIPNEKKVQELQEQQEKKQMSENQEKQEKQSIFPSNQSLKSEFDLNGIQPQAPLSLLEKINKNVKHKAESETSDWKEQSKMLILKYKKLEWDSARKVFEEVCTDCANLQLKKTYTGEHLKIATCAYQSVNWEQFKPQLKILMQASYEDRRSELQKQLEKDNIHFQIE